MPGPSHIRDLRALVGSRLLLVPSVAAVIRDGGRLLLQRKAGGEGWSLPAGAIEPGETPEEALRREVVEETGLRLREVALAAAVGGREFRHTYPNGDRVEYTVLVYRCTPEPGRWPPSIRRRRSSPTSRRRRRRLCGCPIRPRSCSAEPRAGRQAPASISCMAQR
jgi:8-oxo-dGTP pyrophosphatase MutT (NUDIX family)